MPSPKTECSEVAVAFHADPDLRKMCLPLWNLGRDVRRHSGGVRDEILKRVLRLGGARYLRAGLDRGTPKW